MVYGLLVMFQVERLWTSTEETVEGSSGVYGNRVSGEEVYDRKSYGQGIYVEKVWCKGVYEKLGDEKKSGKKRWPV